MERTTVPKADILRDAGYVYHFDRQLYINRKTKKAFSVEFVQDHDEVDIQERILQPTDGREWRFYFNSPPSETVKTELKRVLG